MSLTQINKAGLDEIALDHVFTIGASGSSAYTFQGEGLNGTVNNPTLYLTRGKTYRFENGSGGHPIRIQSTSGASGTAYNTGVTNNAGSGTVIVEVQHNAPDVLYYQCTSHAAMNGILYITGALADGGVTTAKLADDAVTAAKIASGAVNTSELADGGITSAKLSNNSVNADKIAANSVNTSELVDGGITTDKIANSAVNVNKIADNAVTTAKILNNAVNVNKIVDNAVIASKILNNNVTTDKIADQAVTLAKLPHGTSSNDGKFLRANNGADPTFESLPASVTINNDGSHRIMTSGGGTTLDAEGNLTFDGDTLTHGTGGLTNAQKLVISGSGNSSGDNLTLNNWGNSDGDYWTLGVNMTANSGGNYAKTNNTLRSVGINLDGRMGRVIINASETSTSTISSAHTFQRDGSHYMNGALYLNGDTAAANGLDDYETGDWTPEAWRNGGSSEVTLGSGNRYGRYIKIGDLLWVSFYWYNPSASSSTGQYWIIRGLPFNLQTSNTGAYQFIGGGYLYLGGTGSGDYSGGGQYRWQANGNIAANTLTLYSNPNNTNISGQLEFSGCGALRVS